MNNTFIDTSKIVVEKAKMADDPELGKAWSRHTKAKQKALAEQQARENRNNSKSKDSVPDKDEKMKEEKKKKFLDFLNVMKKSNQVWNDDVTQFKLKDKVEVKKDDEAQVEKSLKKAPLVSAENEEAKTDSNKPFSQEASSSSIRGPSGKELTVDEKRLFVLNVPHSITDVEFEGIFAKYGQITECKLPKDDRGIPKGFGYIAFLTEEATVRAFQELDNQVVMGRILHIKPAYQPKKNLYEEVNKAREESRAFKDRAN